MKTVKAISLWEPWATAIALKVKIAETRSWPTNHRGELLICAAKKKDTEAMKLLASDSFQRILQPIWTYREHLGLLIPRDRVIRPEHLNFGKAVAIVNMYDCMKTEDYMFAYCMGEESQEEEDNIEFGDYSNNRFAWAFKDIKTLIPFEVKGSQGFFKVTTEHKNLISILSV